MPWNTTSWANKVGQWAINIIISHQGGECWYKWFWQGWVGLHGRLLNFCWPSSDARSNFFVLSSTSNTFTICCTPSSDFSTDCVFVRNDHHCSYWLLVLLIIGITDYWSHWQLVLLTIGPTDYWSYWLIVTDYWSFPNLLNPCPCIRSGGWMSKESRLDRLKTSQIFSLDFRRYVFCPCWRKFSVLSSWCGRIWG